MIKLACLALLPMSLAAFYAQQEPEPSRMDPGHAAVEEQDRQFLAALSKQAVSVGNADHADQEFLARLQAEERRSAHREMPVLRAIPIERAAMPVARVSTPVVMRESTEKGPEIRRAVAVVRVGSSTSSRQDVRTGTAATALSSANLRTTLHEPSATLGAPEIRRAAAKVGEGRRASIVIFGDQVVIR